VQPTQSLRVADAIMDILGHEEFTAAIVEALDVASSRSAAPDTQEIEARRQAAFLALVRRVAVRIDAHPRKAALLALLRDDDEVPNRVAVELFNFIYFSLVNRFKGEIAELLAQPLLRDFAVLLQQEGSMPAALTVVPGHEILSRRGRRGTERCGWYKGADALITAPHEAVASWAGLPHEAARWHVGLGVVAVAEIKAYRASPERLREQIRHHVRRMARGLCLAGAEVDAGRAVFAITRSDGSRACLPFGHRIPVEGLARIMIRPSLASAPITPLARLDRTAWMAELPPSTDELSEAAYRFTDWFLGQIGTEVYRGEHDVDDGIRRVNPWPEKTIEEAARNRLGQVMYTLGNRPFFIGAPGLTIREERARRTFTFLANGILYGYAGSSGDVLYRPEEHPHRPNWSPPPPPPRPLAAADSAYARGDLAETTALIEALDGTRLEGREARRLLWLQGMVAFRRAEFAEALAQFPGPEEDDRSHWRSRDTHMLARLHARVGSGSRAQAVLAAEPPCSGSLAVEHLAVLALSYQADQDVPGALREAEAGVAALEPLVAEIRQRSLDGRGLPGRLHHGTLQQAMVDFAAVLCATGRHDEAVGLLLRLRGVGLWLADHLRRDQVFAPLFADAEHRGKLDVWAATELDRAPGILLVT
jgi:hypothetical protein